MAQTGTAPVELEVLGAVKDPMTDQDIAFHPTRRFRTMKPVVDHLPKFPGRTMASVAQSSIS